MAVGTPAEMKPSASRPMRVCEITSLHDSDDDRIFQRACLGLVRAGLQVVLVAEHPRAESVGGVVIKPLARRRGLRRRVVTTWEAFRVAQRVPADIYHFHDPELLLPMLLLAAEGRTVVYDVHENYESRIAAPRVPRLLVPFVKAVWRGLELAAVRRLGGVIVVTETMGERYVGYAKHRVVVLNTVDPVRLSAVDLSHPKDPRPVILVSGTHSRARNCMQLVEALPSIRDQVPDVVLRFLGRYHPPGFERDLLGLAERLGVAEHLDLGSMVPWEKNFERAVRAHAGCVFYADNPNNRVGLPNRLFEYMFCGLPVLAENWPELRRVVHETGCGVLVDSSSPASIAAGAARLLSDPEGAKEMGRRGREAVLGRYSFEGELRKMVDFFEALKRQGGNPGK